MWPMLCTRANSVLHSVQVGNMPTTCGLRPPGELMTLLATIAYFRGCLGTTGRGPSFGCTQSALLLTFMLFAIFYFFLPSDHTSDVLYNLAVDPSSYSPQRYQELVRQNIFM